MELKTDMQTNRYIDETNTYMHIDRQTQTNIRMYACMQVCMYVCEWGCANTYTHMIET